MVTIPCQDTCVLTKTQKQTRLVAESTKNPQKHTASYQSKEKIKKFEKIKNNIKRNRKSKKKSKIQYRHERIKGRWYRIRPL